MHRIDSATREVDKFGAGKDGWTGGTPPMVPPTVGTDDWFDDIQETLARYIESRGITLVKSTFTQLVSAIATHFPSSSTDNHVVRFDGTTGQIVQDASPVTISDAGAISGLTDVTLSGEVLYATPKTRVRFVPFAYYVDGTGLGAAPNWTITGTSASCNVNTSAMYVYLPHLPAGYIITRVRVGLNPGDARATAGNRIQLQPYRLIPNTSTGDLGQSALGTASTDDGTTNAQVRTVDHFTSNPYTLIAGEMIALQITSGNNAATGGLHDTVSWVEVQYTDVGPRSA